MRIVMRVAEHWRVAGFINQVIDLCRFKRGPQDFSPSGIVLLTATGLYLVCRIVLALFTMPLHYALMTGVVDLGSLLAFFGALLRIYGLSHRIQQTLTAALLAGILVTGLLILGFGIMSVSPVPAVQLGGGHLFAAPLILWNLAINAHILREALSRKFVVAVTYAVLYYLVVWQLTEAILPHEPRIIRG